MSESREIEKVDTVLGTAESNSKRGQAEEARVGKRGRPSNAEKLGRGRNSSIESTSSISSWIWRRGREQQDSDSESEEKDGKRRKMAEIAANTENAQIIEMERIEKLLEEMGESQERSKKEIIKKIEDSNRVLEKKVMTEFKKEMEKMREENMKVIEGLKKGNVELRRENGNWRGFCGSCEDGEQVEEKNEGEDGERGRERRGENEKDRDSKAEKKEEILRDRCSNNSSNGERKGVNESREVWESTRGLIETWIDEKEWGKLKEKMPKEWKWK
ncbi:PREDICTED: arginine and glutamate-rich protein 1-like [Cyphomyrmex costatus]|uniref:arginine and glutamate-rich protein 1-like n=1 Tax=Cyphomyrmex costatus TaxID=456900 RepID=UPI0008523E66|nr:PREDICTED: arginine and glutamate-rich protein 1-like [Cyphomyrmex costatus]